MTVVPTLKRFSFLVCKLLYNLVLTFYSLTVLTGFVVSIFWGLDNLHCFHCFVRVDNFNGFDGAKKMHIKWVVPSSIFGGTPNIFGDTCGGGVPKNTEE